MWISAKAGPLRYKSIYIAVSERTHAAFGRAVSPHLFRVCVATSIAIEDPDHVYITSNMLNHSTLTTSQKYYNQAHMLEAGRAIQANLVDLRHKLRQSDNRPQKET
jgi:integrase/recombinase XerD